jgi:ABC-type sugar transport system ATPase subunit
LIALEKICLRLGAFQLRDVSFTVPAGCYAVLMGRTGSGKTTVLEILCGLRRQDSGRVLLQGRDATNARPAERGIGYVPQDGALFPTLTVEEHLAFAPIVRRWPRAAVRRRVDELAEALGITHLLRRRPHGLSGGERQRVALGRALAFQPGVLLLDEPLSALDEDTRADVAALLRRLHHEGRFTALHVTHNLAEAERLGDCRLRLGPNGAEWVTPPADEKGIKA